MSSPERRPGRRRDRAARLLGSLLYWGAVLAISLALVVGLVLLLESRDESDVGGGDREGAEIGPLVGAGARAPQVSGPRSSRANTTIRFAAL